MPQTSELILFQAIIRSQELQVSWQSSWHLQINAYYDVQLLPKSM